MERKSAAVGSLGYALQAETIRITTMGMKWRVRIQSIFLFVGFARLPETASERFPDHLNNVGGRSRIQSQADPDSPRAGNGPIETVVSGCCRESHSSCAPPMTECLHCLAPPFMLDALSKYLRPPSSMSRNIRR